MLLLKCYDFAHSAPHVSNHRCFGGDGAGEEVVFFPLDAIKKNHELSDCYFSFFGGVLKW